MSTTMVAFILIACTVLICLIFNMLHKNKESRRKETLLDIFKEAGSAHGLSFSSHEVLRSKIFGLDGLNKTLLIFEHAPANSITCIHMPETKSCVFTKGYDSINMGTGKKARVEKHLRSMDIIFHFKNNREPFSLPFYESNVNSLYEMPELEAKAKTWEALLSKLIATEHKARA